MAAVPAPGTITTPRTLEQITTERLGQLEWAILTQQATIEALRAENADLKAKQVEVPPLAPPVLPPAPIT